MRKLRLHYGDFIQANFNMVDKTAGELEPALRVSKASANTFQPRTSWSNYIQSRCHRLRAFLSQVLCRSSPSSCYYLPCPRSSQTSEYLNTYILDLDGLQTRCTTSVPTYLLHFLFKRVKLAPDGSVGCVKPETLTTFKPRSQNPLSKSGQVGCQIVSSYHISLQ